MSGTEILRQAATLMRERAEATSSGSWRRYEDVTGVGVLANDGAGPWVAKLTPLGYGETRDNAAHIASWHPAVAFAVANWLEWEARVVDRANANYPHLQTEPDAHAFAVANVYLGEATG